MHNNLIIFIKLNPGLKVSIIHSIVNRTELSDVILGYKVRHKTEVYKVPIIYFKVNGFPCADT